MCVAIPGLVESIDSKSATINFNGNTVKANIGLVKADVGDYVLVHAGMVIQRLEKTEAEKMTRIFRELEEAINA